MSALKEQMDCEDPVLQKMVPDSRSTYPEPEQFAIVVLENEKKQKVFDRVYLSPSPSKEHAMRLFRSLKSVGCKSVVVKVSNGYSLSLYYDKFQVWYCYALAYGINEKLAALGTDCFTRASTHDSDGWLLKRYGWKKGGKTALTLALRNAKKAENLWSSNICPCKRWFERDPFTDNSPLIHENPNGVITEYNDGEVFTYLKYDHLLTQ